MECPFETNIVATNPGVEKQIVTKNDKLIEEEMVINRTFPMIRDEKVCKPVTSSSAITFQQNDSPSQENSLRPMPFNKHPHTGRKDNIPILLQRHTKCPYTRSNVVDYPSNAIIKSTNSSEIGRSLDIRNATSNSTDVLSSRSLSKPLNGKRMFANTPLHNTDNVIMNPTHNSISEIPSSNNDRMQKRSLKCITSTSTSGAVTCYTNTSSPNASNVNSNLPQPVSSNQALISQNSDCPFSAQSSSSFHVSKNGVNLRKYFAILINFIQK